MKMQTSQSLFTVLLKWLLVYSRRPKILMEWMNGWMSEWMNELWYSAHTQGTRGYFYWIWIWGEHSSTHNGAFWAQKYKMQIYLKESFWLLCWAGGPVYQEGSSCFSSREMVVGAREAGSENWQSPDMLWGLNQWAFLLDQIWSVGIGVMSNPQSPFVGWDNSNRSTFGGE